MTNNEDRFSDKTNIHGQKIDKGLIREIRQLQEIFGENESLTDDQIAAKKAEMFKQTKDKMDTQIDN